MPLTQSDVLDRVLLTLIEEYAYDPDAGAFVILDNLNIFGFNGLQSIHGMKIKQTLKNKKLHITLCLDL